MSNNPTSFRYPLPEDPKQAVRLLASGVKDLNDAIAALKKQNNATSTKITTIQQALTTLSGLNMPLEFIVAALGGVINVSWAGESGDTVLAAPIGLAGTPSFRRFLGGVDARTTTTETISSPDFGQLVKLSNAAAIAVTLDSTVSAFFMCFVENIGAGTATMTPSTGTIDGAASLALTTNQGVAIFFDGTNFWTSRGTGSGGGGGGSVTSVALTMPAEFSVGGSPVTTAGTLAVTKSNESANTVWAGPTSGAATVPAFRSLVNADLPALAAESALTGKPSASQVVFLGAYLFAFTFQANFSGSIGSVGANPAATATYTVLKNGSSIGTVSISTSGVFTFATSGGVAVSFAAGDRLSITAPSVQDTTLSDVIIVLSATRN